MYRYWRRMAAMVLFVVAVSAAPSTASAHGENNFPWVFSEGGSSGWDRYIKVCYPFGQDDWDLSRLKDAAVNNAINEWNDLGTELHFVRAQATCDYLKNTTQPFVRVVWDTDTCWTPLWYQPYAPCNIDDPMRTYLNVADAWSSEANDYSSNGSGTCMGRDRCLIWAEIRVNQPGNGLYWGTDSQYNFNNDLWTGRGGMVHEFGHATGALGHLLRRVGNIDTRCNDFTYPQSSNAIMCEVIEHKEWNVSPKVHDIDTLKLMYSTFF